MRILVADGDESYLQTFEIALGAQGFNVYGTTEGAEAIDLGKLYDYDAIVLSETPNMHTDTVLRALRNAKVKTPILVVSGLAAVASRVAALDLGADDYMTKPFHIDEVTARLRAIVRRSRGHAASVITLGDLVIDIDSKRVTYAGVSIYLTGKEFQMLQLFALRKGVVQTKEQILSSLYGGMDEPELKIIDVFICKLRKKLTGVGAPHDLIATVWGRGYVIHDLSAEKVELPPARKDPVGRDHLAGAA